MVRRSLCVTVAPSWLLLKPAASQLAASSSQTRGCQRQDVSIPKHDNAEPECRPCAVRPSLAAAEAEYEGGVSPRVSPFADLRDIGALLQRAGFALPVTDVDRIVTRYDSAFALMSDLRSMGATNVLIERRRTPTRRTTMLRMAQIYAERFADADGRIRATFDVIWLSGWAPHESQQKPLQPGSAKASLAEAVRRPKR